MGWGGWGGGVEARGWREGVLGGGDICYRQAVRTSSCQKSEFRSYPVFVPFPPALKTNYLSSKETRSTRAS